MLRMLRPKAMTYYCSECVVNWWPYQALGGSCPRCGGGTHRRQEPASHDADTLFRQAREASALTANQRDFEDYYAAREARRTVEQPTEAIDTLEVWWSLENAPAERDAA
jgi:hypothetical protein